MEEEAKEDPCTHNNPQFQGKAGWLKKAPCRLLATYKERYVRVERTEMVVYENQDLQTCIEKVDLENYDQCQELKSRFQKKHRLILIRSPKAGNKVCDIKFQTPSAEEKEAWIRALRDGINQAKNKVLDEVKVDKSSNLEHVTRSRPRGNANRRPPTKIHMKEVAVVSSEGLLRLDLDLEDAYMPNGSHQTSTGLNGISNDTIVSTSQSDLSGHSEVHMVTNVEKHETGAPPKIKVIPMPPKKKSEPQEEPQDKQVPKAPPPPAQEAKPQACSETEVTWAPSLPANKPRPLHRQPSEADGGTKSDIMRETTEERSSDSSDTEGAEPISSRPESEPDPEQAPPTQEVPVERKSTSSDQSSEDGGGDSDHENISAASRFEIYKRSNALCSWDTSVLDALKPSVNKPVVPFKPSSKARSASIGDLLSDSMSKLSSVVCVEMEETSELLSRVTQAEGQNIAEDLLTEAMEKLRVAQYVLTKANTLTPTHTSRSRKSW
ncbi:pleckstrin homology domain-containing family O member 2 [Gouania willdenowi]|uniref:PH domain-containing protein n=1 Tax=Gouania willdenowi TaxID=441366 RepID=A0A8C5GKQ5_GOUWI|nr:pleckstrin homology domain-containing family O member 2 [Gouania willdenowi]